MQCGNVHLLPSGEVFRIFCIVTPIGEPRNERAVKVSRLRLRPEDFLNFSTLFVATLLGLVKRFLLILLISGLSVRLCGRFWTGLQDKP